MAAKKPGKTKVKGTAKGRLVEEIAAWLHSTSGACVGRNVRRRGRSGRCREIDVLLTAGVAGYPVEIVMECKNEAKPIGVGAIDAFVGKLQDLDVPPRLGIFISASGYTKDAMGRANAAGIRPLLLKGLNPSGLGVAVAEAFDSFVYVVASLQDLSIVNDIRDAGSPQELFVYLDEDGNVRSSIPQLLWESWSAGSIPSILGKHALDLRVPEGLRSVVGGREAKILRVSVTVEVVGLVMTLPGSARQVALENAETGVVEKVGVRSLFEPAPGAHPLLTFKTEEDLDRYFRSKGTLHLLRERIRVPRIMVGPIYWPPSETALDRLKARWKERGPLPTLFEIEGADIAAAWGPP